MRLVLSCHPGLILDTIAFFNFGWRQVAEFAVLVLLVEPRHPPTRGDLEVVEPPPVSAVAGQHRRVGAHIPPPTSKIASARTF